MQPGLLPTFVEELQHLSGRLNRFAHTGFAILAQAPLVAIGETSYEIEGTRLRMCTECNACDHHLVHQITINYLPALAGTMQATQNTANGANSVNTVLSGHTDYVMSVAWSPDGKMLAASSYDTTE